MKIQIINGPNLNLLGHREPEVYGVQPFERYFEELTDQFKEHDLSWFQSNHEGELIDEIHACLHRQDGILINAGGYTHSSIALADALRAVRLPYVEIHLSNTHAREHFRKKSYLAKNASGIIMGFGLDSYRLGVEALIQL